MQPLAWDDFRLVRTIADHRSLGGAADALGVNNSTVFRRLNTLEEHLGVRIFERARSGYLLTSAGEEMVALAMRMAESILEFERRIAGQDVRPSGELRVTTTDTIFSHLVAPMFCAFRQRYPEISLDFVIENRALNLSRRDADVAIRASVDPPQSLIGRRVATIAWGAYASQAFLAEARIALDDIAALTRPPARWVGLGDPIAITAGGRWIATNVNEDCVAVKVNMVSTMASAIQAGLGIGILPCFIGDQITELTRIRAVQPNSETGLWVLTHPDLRGCGPFWTFSARSWRASASSSKARRHDAINRWCRKKPKQGRSVLRQNVNPANDALRLGAGEVHGKQSMHQLGAKHLHAVREQKGALELAGGNATMEILPGFVILLAPPNDELAVFDRYFKLRPRETRHGQRDPESFRQVPIPREALDIVGRIAIRCGFGDTIKRPLDIVEPKHERRGKTGYARHVPQSPPKEAASPKSPNSGVTRRIWRLFRPRTRAGYDF
jgi:DNA-binding transcriptional LysR family regulator